MPVPAPAFNVPEAVSLSRDPLRAQGGRRRARYTNPGRVAHKATSLPSSLVRRLSGAFSPEKPLRMQPAAVPCLPRYSPGLFPGHGDSRIHSPSTGDNIMPNWCANVRHEVA
ncbi:hypothetical protein ELZ88_24080 (plasmid) [Salmonella enterica subsp. enterica serovar Karamoja]|uniref:Uncharacterized protein n=1 Tax=Salmonella enterica subsp. enterica serovar Karamoja TaxID=2500153 RepID=A0A3T0C4P0_SALET|nr:hypothetical protein ELZ88_24080 [Salmonella enterica subsp. enterica serovar Karamoja]